MVNFNLFLLALLIISCGGGGGGGGGSDETTTETPTETEEPGTEQPATVTIPTSPWLVQLGSITAPNNGVGGDICTAIATDSSGNVYCGGVTDGSLGETKDGNADMFIMKLDANGKLEWLTHLGNSTKPGDSSGLDFCMDIGVDSSGNVYCAGHSDDNFGETTTGGNDAFLVKLNSKGELQWTKQLGSTTAPSGQDEMVGGMAVSSSGNIYIGGSTNGTLGTSNAGGTDVFVAKFNSDGALQWMSQHGTSAADDCARIALDSDESVYCAGHTFGDASGTNAGNEDLLIVKFDSSGVMRTVIQEGTAVSDRCLDIVIDSNKNIICSGYTNGDLGETNSGGTDSLIAMFDSSGAKTWITQLGNTTGSGDNTENDRCRAVALNSSGDIFCGGIAKSALTGTYGGGEGDSFLMKVNASGALQSIVQFNSTQGDVSQQEELYDMTIDAAGNIISAGSTTGSFGEANAGSGDVFVLKHASF